MGRRLLRFLIRRVAFGAVTVFLTACFAYGMIRLLRPETYGGGQNLFVGTWQDVDRELLHLGMGGPDLKRDWVAGRLVDIYLLAGGVLFAVGFGVGGGLWCAARPRSRASRAFEAVAMLFLCAPPYVVALLLLLLFASWGALPLPWFFDVHAYAPPLKDPWTFFRAMLVPWFVVGAPLAAQFLRLTLTLTIEAMGEEWVRTAMAKGLPHNRVVRNHAGPSARLAVASLFGAAAPILVTNMVLVESVWSVPGFFVKMRRALGQGVGGEQSINIPALQSLSMWAATLIVALSLLADLAIVRLDPRVRAGGGSVG
jgi:peptide/nickel transport system permease protein